MSEAETALRRVTDGQLLRGPTARREFRQAVKYGIVGLVNVAIDFAAYALLVSFGVWYIAAKAVSLLLATVNGYTWNRRWTFRAGRHSNSTLTRYTAVQLSCYAINVAALALLVEVLGMGAISAQAIVVPFIAGLSFLAQRLWTFGTALR
jgi:putative flippase GtrA